MSSLNMFSLVNKVTTCCPPGVHTYLQQERFEFLVKHDVKSQDFKAGTASHVIREAGAVVMFEDGMGRDERLYDDIINIPPHAVHIIVVIPQPFVDGGDASVNITGITYTGDSLEYAAKGFEG